MYTWNKMSHEAWSSLNDKLNLAFMSGKLAIELPIKFYRLTTEHTDFIEVQPCCILSEPPGVAIRDSNWRGALKVCIPKDAIIGSVIVLVKKSFSGKSWHSRIVKEDEEIDVQFDQQLMPGKVMLASGETVSMEQWALKREAELDQLKSAKDQKVTA